LAERKHRRAIRFWLALFMAGLVLSGVTAFPLQTELRHRVDAWRPMRGSIGHAFWHLRSLSHLPGPSWSYCASIIRPPARPR
jgi:hypothetical protein